MNENRSTKLDSVIEKALREEAFRPVPPGFQGRVEKCIRFEAVSHEEQRKTQYRFATGALLFVALSAMIIVPTISFYERWSEQGVRGWMEPVDYLAVAIAIGHAWQAVNAPVAMVLALVIILTVALGLALALKVRRGARDN